MKLEVFKDNHFSPCIQVLAPFEEIIPLEVYGLSAGTCTVDVNGVQATFDLEVNYFISI